ncbi:MAG TPA: hypothetical protein VFV83_06085 [Chthoniobacteraceae bacterium]|nr:hypothetical protein [Chthoniobacteraceae bacterium]
MELPATSMLSLYVIGSGVSESKGGRWNGVEGPVEVAAGDER